MNSDTPADTSTHLRQIYKLLVLYRWFSLAPALILLQWGDIAHQTLSLALLLAAAGSTLLITLFPARLNHWLRRWPPLLVVDLAYCLTIVALSGGSRSPYYLFSLSPVLAGAFFFHVRGGLLMATAFATLYLPASLAGRATLDVPAFIAQIAGVYLIGGIFGYQPSLHDQLSTTHSELARTHRDLEVIHELTLSMQSAADVSEVEERVLDAVTRDLGFAGAIIALVDQNEGVITSWLGKSRNGRILLAGGLPHPGRVPLAPEGGPIAQCLLDGRARLSVEDVRTSNEQINAHLATAPYHLLPMLLREHAVGVLLVEAAGADDAARLQSLQAIAGQAAVAVGTTMLCIDRAQRLAVQDERLRIAQDIHDTTSQTLFGLHYALNACAKLLPDHPGQVKAELENLDRLAETARVQVRHSILNLWPSEITAERFTADLQKFVHDHCRADGLELAITVRGEFHRLPPGSRRGLYRIAQEAITNVTQHAAAAHASVCMEVGSAEVLLTIRDDGRGFDPVAALARERNREHFGLRGIQERTLALGGIAEFLSHPGAGTTVMVTLPRGGEAGNG